MAGNAGFATRRCVFGLEMAACDEKRGPPLQTRHTPPFESKKSVQPLQNRNSPPSQSGNPPYTAEDALDAACNAKQGESKLGMGMASTKSPKAYP